MEKNINFKNNNMENHNSALLNEIVKKFNLTNIKNNSIKLPSKIEFYIISDERKIIMKLSKESVCLNMQEDSVAFEGWALVVKHWTNIEKIIIEWREPLDTKNLHYQRFLYRLKNFKEHFKAWFSVSSECQLFFEKLRIKEDEIYLMNIPVKRKPLNPENHKGESKLEIRFTNSDDKLENNLKQITNAKFLERQLPVGLFKDKVNSKNEIFPRNKSAIDIWSISNANEILLFELKAPKNNKVGIISELYFYVCMMLDLRKGVFKYEKQNEIRDLIIKTKSIQAFFLSFDLHVLILNRKEIIEDLNNCLPDTTFHFLKIGNDDSLTQIF